MVFKQFLAFFSFSSVCLGYYSTYRMAENEEGMQVDEVDFRRWSDKILYWQERPYVYPFSDDNSG